MIPFRINPSSGTPLYVQLVEHLKHAIEAGAIKAGEQLPSVRRMAEELLINPNTVVRAYRDLEIEEIVVLKHGSGVFVRESVVADNRIGIDEELFGHPANAGQLFAGLDRTGPRSHA